MKFYLLNVLFSLSLSCASNPINKKKMILFTEEFAPYNFSQNNDVIGINTEIVLEACQLVNLDCQMKLLPWARSMKSTKSETNAGLYSTSRTPSREDNFKWVGPLVYSVSCFYKLKERKDVIVNINHDLQNYTIGLMRLDIYHFVLDDLQLEEGTHYLTFAQKHEEMDLFKKGKLDLIIGSSVTLGSQLNKVGLAITDVEPVFILEHHSLKGNYLAINKRIDDKIVIQLQKAIDQLKKNSRIDEITEKYLPRVDKTVPEVRQGLERCVGKTTIY